MTAIGIALLILGFWVTKDYPYTTDNQDAIGGIMLALGAFLAVGGILVWLWRVMP